MMKYLLILIFIGQFFSASAQETLEEKVDQIFSVYNEGPGACIGIVENDAVVYKKCYGNAVLEHDIPMTTNSILDIGTLTMHFTAACILKLSNDGKLSLNDPIQKHLPEIYGDFTLQQMLNHTSGVRDYAAILMLKGESFQEDYDQATLFELISDQRALVIKPGSEYRFAQSNYLLLAKVVEQVSGMKYEVFLRQEFLAPFGMDNTLVYSDKNLLIPHRANAYQMKDDKYVLDQRYNFTGHGDGRIYSSMDDMIKWVRNIKKAKLFEQLIERGKLNSGALMTYANGLDHWNVKGNPIDAHSGYFGGFSSMLIDFSELSKSIIVMSNDWENPAPTKAYAVADVVVEAVTATDGKESPEDLAIVELESSRLQQFTGKYFFRQNGYLREVYLESDTLRYKINENVSRNLVPIRSDVFVIEGQGSSVGFQFSETGMDVLFEGGVTQNYEKYTTSDYSTSDLKAFEGSYFSEELETSLQFKVKAGKLVTYKGDEENLVFRAVMENTFTSEHDGYIVLDENGLVLNDYSLGAVRFERN